MRTTLKGHIAVLKTEERATEKGWVVSRPTLDAPYDLVLDNDSHLYRVQVKYADGRAANSSGAVVVALGHRCDGSKFRHTTYTRSQIDAVIVYVPRIAGLLWFGPDVFEKKRTLYLRLEPSKNGQQTGLNIVEDFIW